MEEKEDILVLNNDEGKVCKNCGQRKPLSEFYRSRRAKDTMQSWCKECQNEYRRLKRKEREVKKSTYRDVTIGNAPDFFLGLTKAEKKDFLLVIKRVTDLLNELDNKKKRRA